MKGFLVLVSLSSSVAACSSKGNAEPDVEARKPAPVTPAKVESKPKVSNTAAAMELMKKLATKQLAGAHFDRTRKFALVDMRDENNKVWRFCPAEHAKTFDGLPAKLNRTWGGRIETALLPDDNYARPGVECQPFDAHHVQCEVEARDEHEAALTFLIAVVDGTPVITGVSERETFMIESEARLAADLKRRDTAFASVATTALDCAKPGAPRG